MAVWVPAVALVAGVIGYVVGHYEGWKDGLAEGRRGERLRLRAVHDELEPRRYRREVRR